MICDRKTEPAERIASLGLASPAISDLALPQHSLQRESCKEKAVLHTAADHRQEDMHQLGLRA